MRASHEGVTVFQVLSLVLLVLSEQLSLHLQIVLEALAFVAGLLVLVHDQLHRALLLLEHPLFFLVALLELMLLLFGDVGGFELLLRRDKADSCQNVSLCWT